MSDATWASVRRSEGTLASIAATSRGTRAFNKAREPYLCRNLGEASALGCIIQRDKRRPRAPSAYPPAVGETTPCCPPATGPTIHGDAPLSGSFSFSLLQRGRQQFPPVSRFRSVFSCTNYALRPKSRSSLPKSSLPRQLARYGALFEEVQASLRYPYTE